MRGVTERARNDIRGVIDAHVFNLWLTEPNSGRIGTARLSRRSNDAFSGLSAESHHLPSRVERLCSTTNFLFNSRIRMRAFDGYKILQGVE